MNYLNQIRKNLNPINATSMASSMLDLQLLNGILQYLEFRIDVIHQIWNLMFWVQYFDALGIGIIAYSEGPRNGIGKFTENKKYRHILLSTKKTNFQMLGENLHSLFFGIFKTVRYIVNFLELCNRIFGGTGNFRIEVFQLWLVT